MKEAKGALVVLVVKSEVTLKRFKGRRKIPEESYKEKDQILRGEVNRLRKEVKRLRKENEKLKGRDLQINEFFDEMELQKEPESPVLDKVCPKCKHGGATILEKLNGGKDYYFCNNPHCMAKGPWLK